MADPGFADPLDPRTLVLARSGAFGDGSHETTQMCLQALVAFAPPPPLRLLDVGSGTGILSIAAAKLDASATAVGVEIDHASNAAARENARLNGVHERVAFDAAWPEATFPIVIANILRGVLVDLADRIVERCAPGGVLVLSGLVSTDVPEVSSRYMRALGVAVAVAVADAVEPTARPVPSRPDVFERGPWRALVFRVP